MSIYEFKVKKADGSSMNMSDFKDQVMLIVNVASACGYTPQYDGLEKLHEKYEKQGLRVLGFPCNQFGAQEPGTDEEIQSFCSMKFNVKFPVLAKIDVNGKSADPLYQWLKEKAPGILGTELIKWNFTKFLVGRNGEVIKRYAPNDKPEDIAGDIEAALKK